MRLVISALWTLTEDHQKSHILQQRYNKNQVIRRMFLFLLRPFFLSGAIPPPLFFAHLHDWQIDENDAVTETETNGHEPLEYSTDTKSAVDGHALAALAIVIWARSCIGRSTTPPKQGVHLENAERP